MAYGPSTRGVVTERDLPPGAERVGSKNARSTRLGVAP